jgi:hypothetical protein
VLEAAEGSFDHIAAFVPAVIERRDGLACWVRPNHRQSAAVDQAGAKAVAVKRGVCQEEGGSEKRLEQCADGTHVAPLARGEIERDETADGIDNGADLGRAAAAASPNQLRRGPPFPPALQRWALQVVLSTDGVSDLSNCTSWSNMFCQIPAFEQRLNRL